MFIETKDPSFKVRFATEGDTRIILNFIKELADYEELLHEVVATEDILKDSLFNKKSAEVIIGEYDGEAVAFALFFHNFSTFLGKAGMYLEDLYVRPDMRGKGLGKTMLAVLGKIAVERNCERLDWWCLDWNKSSIEFYKSIGAMPMDEWTVYRLCQKELKELSSEVI